MPIREVIQDTAAFGGIPLYGLAFLVFAVLREWSVATQLFIGIILIYAFCVPVRLIWFKKRPKKEKYKNWLTKVDASSFPSIHAARATVLAIVVGNLINNMIITVLLAIAVLLVGWTRIHFKRHFMNDVVWGWILGVVVGWIVISFL